MALVDFHTHTTISDGVWTPDQLFSHMRAIDVEVFSVTDHDTMDVYPVPDDLASRCIRGMEVDTKCQGVTTHLLCYGIANAQAPLLVFLKRQREARRARMQEMVDGLRRRGMQIEMSDVETEAGTAASLGRPHLARALVKKGIVATLQEAFDKYIADDRDGFVSLDRLESDQAIAMAHESGAVVSVAHPVRLKNPALLDVLRAAGADGVEVIHPSADESMQRELSSYASRHGMLVTGGTDFHAPAPDYAPGIEMDPAHVGALLDAVAAKQTT